MADQKHDGVDRYIPWPLSQVDDDTLAVFVFGCGIGILFTGVAIRHTYDSAPLIMLLSLNFIIPSALLYWIKR